MLGIILSAGGFMLLVCVLLAAAQAYFGKKFAVPEDPRVEDVNAMLPQANCGACGKAGCHAFAEALVSGEANPGGCTVCTPAARNGIGEYLGVKVVEGPKFVARLACAGGVNVARNSADFKNVPTRREAHRFGGGKGCSWGCLGIGDCAKACAFGAITMNEWGLPIVDSEKCTACKDCVIACPRDLFSIVPADLPLWVACKNLQKGVEAKKECKVACTGCGDCALKSKCIVIKDNLAVIDYAAGIPLTEEPAKSCPTGALVWKR